MSYKITAAFIIYDEGDEHLEVCIPRAVQWLEANSQFVVEGTIIKSDGNKDFNDCLNPYVVDWSIIPDVQFVFLFNAAERPSFAGGTWGIGAPDYGMFRTGYPETKPEGWPNVSGVCSVVSMSYKPWWSHNLWIPEAGFETSFELTLMHEWKNAICSWMNDGWGFNIMNTYERADGFYISCPSFPAATERTDCYGAVLDQLTTEMYVEMQIEEVVPVIPISPLGSMLKCVRICRNAWDCYKGA